MEAIKALASSWPSVVFLAADMMASVLGAAGMGVTMHTRLFGSEQGYLIIKASKER